ncbi:hypothetical protein AAVH_30643 [Aphelenchoides avenae]|nr:hypothetical protein AAVH_30643 [Aphelenchus avenae]
MTRRRNNRLSRNRAEQLLPPTDKWSFWVPAHDDYDSDDQVVEGRPAHSAGQEVEGNDSDVLSEATPRPQSARLTEVSTPAHSAGVDAEEHTGTPHAASSSRTASSKATTAHKPFSFVSDPPSTDVDIEFRKRPSRQDALNEKRTQATTLKRLQNEIVRQYEDLLRAYHQKPGAVMLPQIWSHDWKQADLTRHLWKQYSDLEPIVADRQAAAMRRHRDRAAAGLSTQAERRIDTPEQAAEDSAMEAETPSREIVAEASVTIQLDENEELDTATPRATPAGEPVGQANDRFIIPVEEQPTYVNLPSPQRPIVPPPPPAWPKTTEEELTELLQVTPRIPATSSANLPFRNPSPPATPAHSAGAAEQVAKAKQAAPAHSVGAATAPKKTDSGKPQKPTVKSVKKSGHTSAARDSQTSRSSTGSKRSRVPAGSKHPPAKRIGSRSPARTPSPSLARHLARKKHTKIRHMVPVIDGCVFKNLAIENAKYQTPITIWQTAFDSPTCQYELLGVINEFAVPSTYLPPAICVRIEPSPRTPYVDHTFDQASNENTIIPWKFVLCSTLGAAPTYWQQTTTDAREYLYDAVSRDKLYREEHKIRAIGPVGFDFRSGGHLIPGEFKGQRENLIRFGRIARNVRMPLIVTIDYDELPAGRCDKERSCRPAIRIHLVGIKATALELLFWLEQFPRTVISMDLTLLHGLNEVLKPDRPHDELYRHAAALQKFFQHVSMDNLSLHSGCPQPHNQLGEFRTPAMLLAAADAFERLTGTPRDHLHERNAANLVDLYDLNPDLLDRSTTTTERRDPAIGPRLSRRDLSFVIRTLFGQAPRVDLIDQARTPSRRRASIAEASPRAARRDEPMDTEEAQPRQHPRARSSAVGHRPSRSPSRVPTGRGRSPSRRVTNTNAQRSDQAHSARSDQRKEKPKQGSQQAHSAGWESESGSSANRKATTKRTVVAQNPSGANALPLAVPSGSALENRVFVAPPSNTQVPRGTADYLAFQDHQDDPAATHGYYGPSQPVFLVRGEQPPPRTEVPRTLVWRSDARLYKTQPVHDGNLPDAPAVTEIRAHFEQYFTNDPIEEGQLRQVIPGSLTSTTTTFVYGETIEITSEPGPNSSPFDPTKPCGCGDEVHADFHQTVEKFGLITMKKWANKNCVLADQTGNGMKWLLKESMTFKIQTFGQMIFLKYADRLKGNGPHTGAVLRFMYEVLTTTDWIALIDLLRECQSRLALPKATGPWPQPSDVYAAVESWCCYCPKAYDYVFTRLSGSVVFEPDWLSYRLIPDKLKELLGAVDGVDLFDTIRHRLYTEYGLPLIQALEEHRAEIHWKRFETSAKSKRELCLTETHETICFVDDTTYEQYSANLRETVKMIRIVTKDRDHIMEEVRTRHPLSSVKRVVFWMAHGFLLEGGDNLCLLLSELVHHYEAHYPNIEKYVVMPPYIRRRRVRWTDHVLGTYIQRDEILPNTRVVLLSGDLQLWDFDRRHHEAGKPLPAWNRSFVDEEGRCLSDTALCLQRIRFRQHHDLDLWTEVDEELNATEPAPSTSAATAKGDAAAFIAAGLPAEVVTPEVTERIRLYTEALRTKIVAEVTERTTQELQPKIDRVDAVYEYILQKEQQDKAQPKIAEKPAERRSASRSPMDHEPEQQ